MGVSFAAVLAVYTAGYVRTKSAADRLEARAAEWRVALPGGPRTVPHAPKSLPTAPNSPAAPFSAAASASSNPMGDAAGTPRPIASAESVPTTANVPGGAAAAWPDVPVAAPIATQSAETAAPAAPAPTAPESKDGTYYGWGVVRHGEVQAAVVIEGGRISSVKIAQCLTRYSCDVTTRFSPLLSGLQMPHFYWVSGATETAEAFQRAVLDALSKVK